MERNETRNEETPSESKWRINRSEDANRTGETWTRMRPPRINVKAAGRMGNKRREREPSTPGTEKGRAYTMRNEPEGGDNLTMRCIRGYLQPKTTSTKAAFEHNLAKRRTSAPWSNGNGRRHSSPTSLNVRRRLSGPTLGNGRPLRWRHSRTTVPGPHEEACEHEASGQVREASASVASEAAYEHDSKGTRGGHDYGSSTISDVACEHGPDEYGRRRERVPRMAPDGRCRNKREREQAWPAHGYGNDASAVRERTGTGRGAGGPGTGVRVWRTSRNGTDAQRGARIGMGKAAQHGAPTGRTTLRSTVRTGTGTITRRNAVREWLWVWDGYAAQHGALTGLGMIRPMVREWVRV
ncbi:hypothetical protein DFH09DRAFT_1411461 [Mycena vulgaris]|nr:hypothetical protein DFH09DRAFT_1411461 [Mycena vulgaris]